MASHGDTSDQQVAIGIISGLLVLTTFVVYVRLYVRCIFKARLPGWDDLTAFIAWVMALGASLATYVEIASGLGRHIDEISSDQLWRFNACRYAAILLSIVGLTSVKLSFLAQYYRTFADRTIRRICMCVAFYCTLWMVVQAILHSFSCIPIEYLIPAMVDVCILSTGIWSAIAMINSLTNIIIFCIPWKPLWELNLLKRQKYLLGGIFCFGLVICIMSVALIPALRHTASSTDQTSTYAAAALLSLAELELAIVCTSLPVLRPIIARFVPGVSPPDPSPNTSGRRFGFGCFRRRKRRANPCDESPLDTAVSGSTLTNWSFFKPFNTRDEDREDEQPVLLTAAEAKRAETKNGHKGEKKIECSTIVEVYSRKKEEQARLGTPLDFFHHPSLQSNKETKMAPPIVPRDLRRGASLRESSKASTPITFSQNSPQSSPRKPLFTPTPPLSTYHSGDETNEQSSARTTNSFFRPRSQQGDDFISPDSLLHTCKINSEALKRDICSMCSSELLPDRLRPPGPPLPHLPPSDDQVKDAGTQTSSSRVRSPTSVSQKANDTMVTQSTQTATPWESSPRESSRPPSPQTQTSEEERVVVEVARQGTIARARERAMQAIADKTYGQVGEVHQGRARVVQVDTSQRRQAAIGLEEVLGLDFDSSPRRPAGVIQSRKEAMRATDENSSKPTDRLARERPASKRVQMADLELTSNQRQKEVVQHEIHGKETVKAPQTSPSQVDDAGDQAEPTPSSTDNRAAATSWLRLSTDLTSIV